MAKEKGIKVKEKMCIDYLLIGMKFIPKKGKN